MKQLLDQQAVEDEEYEDCKRITEYLKDILDQNGEILADEAELTEKINNNRAKLDAILLKLEKLKGEIVKLENEKTLAMHTKEQLENFFKKENKQKRFSIMFNVPNAGMSFQLILRKDLNRSIY